MIYLNSKLKFIIYKYLLTKSDFKENNIALLYIPLDDINSNYTFSYYINEINNNSQQEEESIIIVNSKLTSSILNSNSFDNTLLSPKFPGFRILNLLPPNKKFKNDLSYTLEDLQCDDNAQYCSYSNNVINNNKNVSLICNSNYYANISINSNEQEINNNNYLICSESVQTTNTIVYKKCKHDYIDCDDINKQQCPENTFRYINNTCMSNNNIFIHKHLSFYYSHQIRSKDLIIPNKDTTRFNYNNAFNDNEFLLMFNYNPEIIEELKLTLDSTITTTTTNEEGSTKKNFILFTPNIQIYTKGSSTSIYASYKDYEDEILFDTKGYDLTINISKYIIYSYINSEGLNTVEFLSNLTGNSNSKLAIINPITLHNLKYICFVDSNTNCENYPNNKDEATWYPGNYSELKLYKKNTFNNEQFIQYVINYETTNSKYEYIKEERRENFKITDNYPSFDLLYSYYKLGGMQLITIDDLNRNTSTDPDVLSKDTVLNIVNLPYSTTHSNENTENVKYNLSYYHILKHNNNDSINTGYYLINESGNFKKQTCPENCEICTPLSCLYCLKYYYLDELSNTCIMYNATSVYLSSPLVHKNNPTNIHFKNYQPVNTYQIAFITNFKFFGFKFNNTKDNKILSINDIDFIYEDNSLKVIYDSNAVITIDVEFYKFYNVWNELALSIELRFYKKLKIYFQNNVYENSLVTLNNFVNNSLYYNSNFIGLIGLTYYKDSIPYNFPVNFPNPIRKEYVLFKIDSKDHVNSCGLEYLEVEADNIIVCNIGNIKTTELPCFDKTNRYKSEYPYESLMTETLFNSSWNIVNYYFGDYDYYDYFNGIVYKPLSSVRFIVFIYIILYYVIE